eukprot:1157317-Pelagomonas_calceolata.AAC.4
MQLQQPDSPPRVLCEFLDQVPCACPQKMCAKLVLLQGRIDLFFFFLGGLMMANLAVFIAVAVRYQYKQEHQDACTKHMYSRRTQCRLVTKANPLCMHVACIVAAKHVEGFADAKSRR